MPSTSDQIITFLNLSKWVENQFKVLLWEKVNRNCNEKVDFDRIGTQWL
jgi:hypothetical protein